MKPACNVATLIERFFTERLMRQRNVSANTIASYKDTFRLLFMFAQERLRRSPSALTLTDLDATFIGAFLTDLEAKRGASAKTRNLRLTAIRSFFRFVSFEEPAHSALIQRVLPGPEERESGLIRHDLDTVTLAAVLEDARSPSLFAPRRVLVVSAAEAALPRTRAGAEEAEEEGGSGKGAASALAVYLKDPSPDVVLVFEAARFDFEGEEKRKLERVRKFYAAVPTHWANYPARVMPSIQMFPLKNL